MDCQQCGAAIKTVPAGVSKSSGKAYDSFQVCSNRGCGWRPPRTATPAPRPAALVTPPPGVHNGDTRDKAMLMAYAKDLVVAEMQRGDQFEGNSVERAITYFHRLVAAMYDRA
jgi:hypothetical protein